MFKTFAQILVTAALSLGVMAGFKGNVQSRVADGWTRAATTVRQAIGVTANALSGLTVDIGGQGDVSTNVEANGQVSADAGVEAAASGQNGSSFDLKAILPTGLFNYQVQAGGQAEADVTAQASNSAEVGAGQSSLVSQIATGLNLALVSALGLGK